LGIPQMMWAALDTLPLASLTKVLALIGLIIYFVTSSDSASHVIDVLTASGNEDPPKLQRLFWAVSEGAVAAVLLSTGDEALSALQTASLVAAAPFAVVLLCETYATYLTMKLHCGEYSPRDYLYWRYDLFSIGENAPLKSVLGLLCPPYFQTMTRLKLTEYSRVSTHADSEKNGNSADSFGDYKDDGWKYVWIFSYWLTWLLTVVFIICELAGIDGMLELCLTSFLFYLAVAVVNRNAVRQYYKIDSSNSCYGCLSWLFCCCFAVVQESMQTEADFGVDLKVGASDSQQELKGASKKAVASSSAMKDTSGKEGGTEKGEYED
jgi:Cys-rich protein (TIGR01571 family)